MATNHGKAACGVTGTAKGTVRALYEAALREVSADPVAALAKYQPTWLGNLPAGSAVSTRK